MALSNLEVMNIISAGIPYTILRPFDTLTAAVAALGRPWSELGEPGLADSIAK
jgi:hypothetical protein